jgi:hypothetical protein
MKITFVGHASILIEVGSISILSDPWWRGPCFGAQWWNYPSPYIDVLDQKRIDFVYISHGHHDHLHHGTLRTFSRDTKILISRKANLARHIAEMGFEVIELDDDAEFALGTEGVVCRIMATHSNDTLMAITDGREVCLNLNDALHSAPEAVQLEFLEKLKHIFPRIDYIFCGYGTASHFPNCYVVPGKDRVRTAARRQQYFNRQWAKIINGLQPHFGFPFAADVVFLEEDLFWANEPIHNSERPTDAFHAIYPGSKVTTMDIAPGFTIQDGIVSRKELRKPVLQEDLRATYADQIDRTNRYGTVDDAAVKEVAALLQKSVELCNEYLRSYDRDYRFLIRFRNSESGILIEKLNETITLTTVSNETADELGYDLTYTTRLAYLRRSLTEPFGDEILFVGSGGVFEYANQSDVKCNLHREFQLLLRQISTAPQPRYGASSKKVFKTKQVIKSLLGLRNRDLYDLSSWTVYAHD